MADHRTIGHGFAKAPVALHLLSGALPPSAAATAASWAVPWWPSLKHGASSRGVPRRWGSSAARRPEGPVGTTAWVKRSGGKTNGEQRMMAEVWETMKN